MRNIVLNLPLYQGVEEISVGLDEHAAVLAPPGYVSGKKVVVYGTSITQGGCASRPGMAYTNILSRRIPLEFINLGFSGSGKGEPEVAEIVSQINDPACLVVDYEGNCVSTELFRETLPEFIRIYRAAHPLTPILVVSRIRYAREDVTPHLYEMRMERKRFEQALVNELREKGDLNLYFFDGSHSLGGEDYYECTVDGSHPNDLGFLRMADALEPVLKTLLL
jgi:lysophospholipase L1-like esterase